MAPTGSRRRAKVVAGGTAVVVLTSILVTGTASADQVADTRAEAAALARTIDAQGRQLELLAEQYDGARVRAQDTADQLARAEADLTFATGQEAAARGALTRQAIEAYMHDGYLSPPTVAPDSPSLDLSVQRGYFSLATGDEAAALARLRATQRVLRDQQATLEAARRDADAAVVAVAARSRAVEAADAASKATLARVQGRLVQLVAEQQAQLEADQVAAEQRSVAGAQPIAAAAVAPSKGAPAPPAPPSATTVAPVPVGVPVAAPATRPAATTTAPPPPQLVAVTVTGVTVTPSPRPTDPPRTTAVAPTTTAPPATPPPGPDARGLRALAYAVTQLGKPYQWGAAGPSTFDCSGLTMRAWQAAGVSLPHFAAAQYADIAHVAIANLQPGDLVFFGTDLHHVGIYAGNGQMIDAPYTGTVVRYDSIYWGDLFGAGRP